MRTRETAPQADDLASPRGSLERRAEPDLVPGEPLGGGIELLRIASVLFLRGRREIDRIEEDGKVLGDVVARAHIELTVRLRVHRLVRLLYLPHASEELAAMSPCHASLNAVLLEESH